MTLELLFIIFVCVFTVSVSLLINALFTLSRKYHRMAGLWREECNERKIEQQKLLAVHAALLNWTGDLPKNKDDFTWSTTYVIANRLRLTLDSLLLLTDKCRTRPLVSTEIRLLDHYNALIRELNE